MRSHRFLKLLIVILLAGSFRCTFSQSTTQVQLGQMVRQTMKEAWADLEPMGQDDQGVYYLALPYSAVMSGPMIADADYHLFMVNDAAELTKKNPANFKVDGAAANYEFTREMNGKIIVFTSVEDKKQRKVSFHALELDKKELQLTNPKKVVELSFAHLKRDYERASFKSELSRDKSKMLISYSLVDDENSMLTFGYVVLDGSLKEL